MDYRRIVFTAPHRVEVVTEQANFTPIGPREVLVRNLCSLVSAGTELACLSGTESWFPLPGTPGYASVGEIIAIGTGIPRLAIGDQVFTHGPHAEIFKINVADRYTGLCVKIPEGLPAERALFARIASIALTSVRVAEIELGDQVLVIGLGQVGILAAQLAQLQGAEVFGADLNAQRRRWAQDCGISSVIDSNDSRWKDRANESVGGHGFTTVIDATGSSAVITEATSLVAPYGEIILLGTPRAGYQTDVTEVFGKIHLQPFISIKGALEWRYPTFRNEFIKHSVERNTEILLGLIAERRLAITPFFTHKLGPESAPEAYRGLLNEKEKYAGVVFDWRF